MKEKKIILVLKSFGDAIIPLTCQKITKNDEFIFLFGDHLSELIKTINQHFEFQYKFLNTSEKKVPSMFDIKKSTPLRVFMSYKSIKKEIQSLRIKEPIYVDKFSWRERAILGDRGSGIPTTDNIYQSYLSLMSSKVNLKWNESKVTCGKEVLILPNSRLRKKNLSVNIIKKICKICNNLEITPTYCQFEDERTIRLQGLKNKIIKKNFCSLIEIISCYDKAICADSFPLHLRTFLGMDSFLVKNFKNHFWMPPNVIANKSFSLSDDNVIDESSLVEYLLT